VARLFTYQVSQLLHDFAFRAVLRGRGRARARPGRFLAVGEPRGDGRLVLSGFAAEGLGRGSSESQLACADASTGDAQRVKPELNH
jgi:hypothetical protein